MTRDVRGLRRLLRVQDLKKRATEAQYCVLRTRQLELQMEEDACLSLLQDQTFAVSTISRSLTRRVAGFATRKKSLGRRIEETQDQVRLETLRSDRVREWLESAEDCSEEEQLAEASQDAVVNKIHTSG